MSSKRLSAGDYIEARCTRCRTTTNHTIIAMVEERPVRVRCNTCDGDHNYRAPRKEAAGRTRTVAERPPRSTAKSRAHADQEQWQEAVNQTEAGLATPYTMDRAFKQNEIVAHPTFGLGVVTGVQKPDKVEILFTGGKKLLRCKL
jgi:hypothetical protein